MLKGKRIIVTRKSGQQDRIGNTLRKMGAEVVNLPLLDFRNLEIRKTEWKDIINNKYQWVVFTI